MSENAVNCINCDHPVDSNFCPNCGQKVNVRPITWKGLLAEFSARWIGLDNRIVRTFKNLWTRPSTVIDEYLHGNRVKYIGPLSYLVVMSALYILSFRLFGVSAEEFLADSSKMFQTDQTMDENQQKVMEEFMKVISTNMRLMVAALIPFMSLSLIIFYEKRNYLQNFLAISYLTSQMLWLSILFVAIIAVTGYNPQFIGLAINLSYFVWVVGSLNKQENNFVTYMRAFFAWLIGYIFFMVASVVFALIYLVVMFASQR